MIKRHTALAVLRIIVFTVITAVLSGTLFPGTTETAGAAPVPVKWTKVNIPKQGDTGNQVLAKGIEPSILVGSSDEALYTGVKSSGTGETLYKSTDNGITWRYTGSIPGEIIDIATVAGMPSAVYCATNTTVYMSKDAGASFTVMPPVPGLGGKTRITCIAACYSGSGILLAAGTADIDSTKYGGIYILDEKDAAPAWSDTGAGNYDIYDLCYSPGYSGGGWLTALVSDELDTLVIFKKGSGAWNGDKGRGVIPGIVPLSGMIVFPGNYNPAANGLAVYCALDTGNGGGDVFRIDARDMPLDSLATDLGAGADCGLAGVDIAGLAAGSGAGSARLFAGSANCTAIYCSENNGANWTRCIKRPSGVSGTRVVCGGDGRLYAASSGKDGGVSVSVDNGRTWNQISLLNADITSNGILDIAVSPRYILDGTIFMVTFDAGNLEWYAWRSRDGGNRWERILSSSLDDIDRIDRVGISPAYGAGGRTLYLAGGAGGVPVIWKSVDDGQTFVRRNLPLAPDAWITAGDDTVIIGVYDGTDALVFRTDNGGQSFSAGVKAGKQPLSSIAVSPAYSQDGTILAGSSAGMVYLSTDRGLNFLPLSMDSLSSPFSGAVTVVFHPGFGVNHTVYAASDSPDEGIYRLVTGENSEWERIGAGMPSGGYIQGMDISSDGVLYAVNSQTVDAGDEEGGIMRSLNPAFQLHPTFETILDGLDDGGSMKHLRITGNRLFAIDSVNTRLMVFEDTMTQPVILRSPADITTGIETGIVRLDWEAMDGATEYEWQVDYHGSFLSIPEDSEGKTSATSVRVSAPENDTSYHWRVRAVSPVLSPWSESRSFRTALGQKPASLALLSPGAGANAVSVEPVFQWSAIAGAEKYELLVSADHTFNKPVIEKTGRNALPVTAWQCNISLEYDRTYYWKVRGAGSGSYSDWSAVSIFVTEARETPRITVIPAGTPLLLSPGAASEGVTVKPLFQWDSVTGAEKYELVVSADAGFDNPVILKSGDFALRTTAWKSNVSLDEGVVYYWKVRAVAGGGISEWSPVSAFSTGEYQDIIIFSEKEPQPQSQAVQPVIVPVPGSIPEAVYYLGVGLLGAVLLMQGAVMVVLLLTRNRRL